MKYIISVLVALMVFVLGVYNKEILNIINNYKEHPVEVSGVNKPKINIKSISKLETIEISIKNKQYTVKGLKGNPVFGQYLGDTYDVFVKVSGKVIAGIDLEKIQVIKQDDKNKTIILSIPKSKILHVYPDATPTVELYKRHGMVNGGGQPSESEKNKARDKAKKMLSEDANNADILNRATEKAEQYIKEYVKSFDYIVEFSN